MPGRGQQAGRKQAVKLSHKGPQEEGSKSRHLPDPFWDLEETGQLPGPILVSENRGSSSLL